ncbi:MULTISPECIES: aminotransferase class I/II-fold pyridoxal phosphate-dependent enzyme [unclassified Nocardioides]|uniref:aminotransferase class I/II-fold pyridoxal phosphate-dependent enzyme n=1 Tax=unclassified Nocardioides TaxID=2615069 RepID=UPI0007039705|nr:MULTISPECIES: aminotransferase class I/II-fold pyridoxal phosphate-dependent enzyme [unclassified Nocardioides]KRC52708.1 aminotransferase [Nocardioides sp. Root79]KRC72240.1 aminotransferase [Nocardioides sp. Root240]
MTTSTPLSDLSADELAARLTTVRADYDALTARGLKLDLTRGKPGADQLDLSNGLLGLPTSYQDRSGTDLRNYGGLDGLVEIREIFADLLGVDLAAVVCGGNSSLTMMYQVITAMLLKGGPDSPRPWSQEPVVKFVCPVPGYDRHFTMLAELGIEMVTVPMNADGPDVAAVRALVADDPTVKGMWIVPTYANPTGSVCSPEVAAELVALPTAAPDFRILWDNAYAVHHLTEDELKSADVLGLAAASGHPNRPIMFASTSKITFAGAGVAALAASPENRAWYLQRLGFASIGPDKLNHLRHVEFFGDADGVRAHMRKHRDLIAPKFAAVEDALSSRLSGLGIAEWTAPTGGYFVNLDVLDGTATRVVALAKDAGIALTPAGSAFPHGDDPRDRNIRLAPTFPVLEEVEAAMAGVAVCVELAALEKLSA